MTVPKHADYPAHEGFCPQCGHNGPHAVQHDGFQLEFACEGCGLQFEVPDSYKQRLRRSGRKV